MEFLDRHLCVLPQYQRGFLTAIVQGIDTLGIPATFMIAGTAFSLALAERVFPGANKRERVRLICQFAASSPDDVEREIGNAVDLDGCSIAEPQRHKLSGRKRYSMSVITFLADGIAFGKMDRARKQDALNAAVNKAIQRATTDLTEQVRTFLSRHDGGT